MPSALPAVRAVPYDAYSPDHLHDRPPSTSPQHQPAAAAGVPPSARQPWYEISDGAVTPPDDSSSSSNRGDFVGHIHAPALPHGVTSAKRRPLGCRLAVGVCTDLLLLTLLAVCAYFLRLHNYLCSHFIYFRSIHLGYLIEYCTLNSQLYHRTKPRATGMKYKLGNIKSYKTFVMSRRPYTH